MDSQTKQLAQSNVIVSGILLLRNNYGGKVLIAPDARGAGKNYYGFNTMNQEGVETLEALMHFLGDRYMNSNGKYGTVVNWIVGNEVNNYNDYNYLGRLGFQDYIEAYTRSFRIVDMALRSVYSNARVYISLDHLWNMLQPHGKCFTSRSTLDAFAACLQKEGDINWNLAFHPYPSPLTDANFWNDNVTNSDSTKQVTMKNLSYLSNYVSTHFRSDVRIILSEQGFTSRTNGVTNETKQAAAWAYAYYITEFNDKVDSFIMNRHVDHVAETSQGLYLGVWTNKKGNLEYANKKKQTHIGFREMYSLVLFVMDTLGLAIFTVIGIEVALATRPDAGSFLLVFVGTVTGVGGGLLRDMMSESIPYIFQKHIYATACIVGAVICVIFYRKLNISLNMSMIVGAIAVLVIRALAAQLRWNLPTIHLDEEGKS